MKTSSRNGGWKDSIENFAGEDTGIDKDFIAWRKCKRMPQQIYNVQNITERKLKMSRNILRKRWKNFILQEISLRECTLLFWGYFTKTFLKYSGFQRKVCKMAFIK